MKKVKIYLKKKVRKVGEDLPQKRDESEDLPPKSEESEDLHKVRKTKI